MIIDTHCHLASAQFDQSRRETYVQHALREGIDRMITLGARCLLYTSPSPRDCS